MPMNGTAGRLAHRESSRCSEMILRSYACQSDECECPRAMSSAAQAFGVRTWLTFPIGAHVAAFLRQ